MIIDFGKYKGKSFDDIPEDYLRWFVANASYDHLSKAKEVRRYLLAKEIQSKVVDGEYRMYKSTVGLDKWNSVLQVLPMVLRSGGLNAAKYKTHTDEVLVITRS